MGSKRLNRTILSWGLFDFANSILVTNGALYFSQWLVIDKGINDIWYNITIAITSLIVLLTAPLIGLVSDRKKATFFFLWFTSFLMFVFTIAIALNDYLIESFIYKIIIALISFAIINFAYQISSLFYDSLLGWITNQESYGKISGFGFAAGWIGAVFGLIVILPFVQGKILMFSTPQRINAFIPSAILFGIFTIISLCGMKSISQHKLYMKDENSEVRPYRQLINDIKQLRYNKKLWMFYLIYFLVTNSILTIQANIPLYLEKVLQFSDSIKAILITIFFIMAAFGGIIFGRIADRKGLFKTLFWVILLWCILLFGMIASTNQKIFIVVFLLIGIQFGALWAIIRAIFNAIVPSERRSQYFGLYVSFEQTATFIGPLVWGATLLSVKMFAIDKYRIAVLIMNLILLSSLLVVKKVIRLENRDSEGITK